MCSSGSSVQDRVDDRRVVLAGEGRVDPALEANLGRAPLPGLAGAADDFLMRHEVRRTAQVRSQLSFRKGAEAAAEVADVRVLDVACDDVADLVTADLAPKPVGGREHPLSLLAAGAEEADELVLTQFPGGVDRERIARDDERGRSGLARMPRVLPGEPDRVGGAENGRPHLPVDPLLVDIPGVDRQSCSEVEQPRPSRPT